jgi:hypothetical protein
MHAKTDLQNFDGATFSTVAISFLGNTIGVGVAAAPDALCSQAHVADQRLVCPSRPVCWSSRSHTRPCSSRYWFLDDLLLVIQQPAHDFCGLLDDKWQRSPLVSWLLLPELHFMFLYELLKKVLQT